MTRRGVAAAWALAALAAPAAAQPSDPIDEVLRRPPPPEPQSVGEPVFVDQTGRTPDRPPTVADQAYDSRIRASSASAQVYQGALDGGWTLASADGGDLYAFQLSDRGNGAVEGAWRDLRKPGALSASGFVDQIERVGGEIVQAGFAVRAIGEALGRPVGKLNVGQLGNVTPQLHVHVVGRSPDDPAWPGPVWGVGVAEPYAADALERAMAAARSALRL